MAHTIKGFQIDMAAKLSDEIEAKLKEDIAVSRILTALQTYGVVNDHTYWRKLPQVLGAFGIDYDEIVEVAP
ncbi:hypothetical protein SEA_NECROPHOXINUS_91 [Microbacterium phage Necrophoxinus]|nr:hypothetical protein SEA_NECROPHOXINUS_91 [Microbacterium phage Necrophoxinus]